MMMQRRTYAFLAVLVALRDEGPSYGKALMAKLNMRNGTVYSVLHRALAAGLVELDVEPIHPSQLGRPARHWYRITPAGEQYIRNGHAIR